MIYSWKAPADPGRVIAASHLNPDTDSDQAVADTSLLVQFLQTGRLSLIDRSQFVRLMVRKLNRLQELGDAEVAAIESLPFEYAVVKAQYELVRQHTDAARCALIIDGYASSLATVQTGRSHSTAFYMAGDIVGAQYVIAGRPNHNVQTITPGAVCWIATSDIKMILDAFPAIELALVKTSLIDLSIAREWIANIGCRDGITRLAHLICELFFRRNAIGLPREDAITLPFTQEQLGSAIKLTAVHTNRMLRELTVAGALDKKGPTYRISDWQSLKDIADFDPAYLY